MKKNNVRGGKRTETERKIDRSHTTDTSEEDDSHAVITVHPNKVRKITKIEKEKERTKEEEEKDALSSESWQFSPSPASI